MSVQRLTERLVQSQMRVDRATNILHDVKLLGATSPNRGGIDYRPAMEAAVALYDGVPVLPYHSSEEQPRTWRDAIGIVREPYLKEDGIYGKIEGFPDAPGFRQLLAVAESAPQWVGSSHEAWVVLEPSDDPGFDSVAREIERVEAISIVDDPATTQSLFESRQPEGPRSAAELVTENENLRRELTRFRLQEALDAAMVPKSPAVRSERWLEQLAGLEPHQWSAEIADRMALLKERDGGPTAFPGYQTPMINLDVDGFLRQKNLA